MTIQPAGAPTSDEKLLAGLSHFFGPVIALIIWATQKDKSRFVRFQAIQAVAFDVVFIAVFFVGFACMFALIFGGMLLSMFGTVAASDNSGASSTVAGLIAMLGFVLPIAAQCVMFAIAGVFFVARIIAAISVFQGKDFRYPVLGVRVEKFLG